MTVTEHLKSAGNHISFEVLPPLKGKSINLLWDHLDPLMEFKPDFINVTYHRSESMFKKKPDGSFDKVEVRKRPGTVGICAAIMNRYKVDAVAHLICGGFSKQETEDALIDLNIDSPFRHENFLMEMLTSEPNYIRHYNHIAFQSFYVHPQMLETMDKLRFDCYRVGTVKETIEEMEPVIRNSSLFSFDISALAHAFAPASSISPNGLNGEEACALMRYAGMSPNINSIGIYGFDSAHDKDDLTAKQIAHMIWYILDGRSRGRKEVELDQRDSFNEYHIAFAEVETTFLQSKKTGRWWMQLPDKNFIACSYKDYLLASSNEIPERWLRAQERS